MYICYIDESGCTGVLPASNSPIQPIFTLNALAINQRHIASLTWDLIHTKERFFPNLWKNLYPDARGRTASILDWMTVELKGSDLRTRIRNPGNRNSLRQTHGVLNQILAIIEKYDIKLFGRIWVKGIGAPVDGNSIYTYSVQDICKSFNAYLASVDDVGVIISDSRTKVKNSPVQQSVVTLKYMQPGGDKLPRVLETPTFGHSENHAGLQLADLICSAFIFPMASYAYCLGAVTSVHVDASYSVLSRNYGARLRNLQYRYQDSATGRWLGGLRVNDGIAQKHGGYLFNPHLGSVASEPTLHTMSASADASPTEFGDAI